MTAPPVTAVRVSLRKSRKPNPTRARPDPTRRLLTKALTASKDEFTAEGKVHDYSKTKHE